jgi:hypothetical protein
MKDYPHEPMPYWARTLGLILIIALSLGIVIASLYVSWKENIKSQCLEWSGARLKSFSDNKFITSTTHVQEQRYFNCMYENGIDVYPKPPPPEPEPLWKAKIPVDGNRTG